MEVTNLLNIGTRAELYRWFLDNHDKVSDFWLRVNHANAEYPGVIRYVDAVEVVLCESKKSFATKRMFSCSFLQIDDFFDNLPLFISEVSWIDGNHYA